MAKDLNGKVVLMTGATEGIGKAAALELAKRGATLVLVGRNRDKSERVVAELKSASGNEAIALLLGDLSKSADVLGVAAAFRARHQRLDVLINNAGAVFATHQLSADGFEMTFALNHLAYFLLTHTLLDMLIATPGARVVNTASAAHLSGKLDLDTIARRLGKGAGMSAYADSKLANVLFTRELARRLAGSGVTANCFHPGFVQSGFGANNQGLLGLVIKIAASLFGRSPVKGAETLVWLAASPDAARFSGEYFFNRAVGRTSARAKDSALAARLWRVSEVLCGLTTPDRYRVTA